MIRQDRPSSAVGGKNPLKADGLGPPSWSEIEKAYGTRMAEDIRSSLASRFDEKKITAESLGIRHLLGWLSKEAASGTPVARRLVRALSGRRGGHLDPVTYLQAMLWAFNQWFAHRQKLRMGSLLTASRYAESAANTLESLGRMDGARYPKFLRRLVCLPKYEGDVVALGSLGWPEIAEVKGAAARERAALRLVEAEAVGRYLKSHELFRFGREVLGEEGVPAGVDPAARRAVRRLLEAERRSFTATGESQFQMDRRSSATSGSSANRIPKPEVWEAAGLPPGHLDRLARRWNSLGGRFVAAALVLPCIGATLRSTSLLVKAFCCETGWNLQPILDLPDRPFAFRNAGEAGLGGSAFLESYKTRAHHGVVTRLEERRSMAQDDAKAVWTAKVQLESWGSDDHAILAATPIDALPSVLKLLDAHLETTAAIRVFDRQSSFGNRFFPYLTLSGVTLSEEDFRIEDSSAGLLGREGTTYRAIRASRQILRFAEAGSTEAMRAGSGNEDMGVLMKHYLKAPAVTKAMEASIRLVQNGLQAHVLGTLRSPRSVDFVMTGSDREWFLRISALTGISAAIGAVPVGEDQPGGGAAFRFIPTPANLADLYLTHLALKRSRRSVGNRRWVVQAMPMLAIVKAIGLTLIEQGLIPEYIAAARLAHADLVAGRLSLPTILEA